MLSFFRRIINSKFGVVITIGGLVLIALAFALGDITGLGGNGARRATGDVIATVGKFDITATDLRRRVQTEMEAFRQDQPQLDMASFVAGGGVEGTLERYINNIALEQFGLANGMVVGRKAIDSQIAGLPQLKGVSGEFDDKLFQQFLAAQRLSADQFRGEVARVTMDQQLTAPTLGASQVPDKMALPYASLLLEKRSGHVAFIPAAAVNTGPAPTDQEIADYYKRNTQRYMVRERRTIRYAMVSVDAVKQKIKISDDQIAAAYKANAAKYAARETRDISQVVIADQKAAEALAAKIKGGMAIDIAARTAGLEAAKLTAQDQPTYTGQVGADLAKAVFGAARGAVIGPIKAPLGWIVAHVDAINQIPAKTLAQARPEILARLTTDATTKQLAAIRSKIDDALNGNATFDELVKAQGLTPATTPPVFPDGRSAANPVAPPDPTLAPIVTAGFAASPGDAPQMVPVGNDGGFALVALDQVTPAAPAPLAEVKTRVAADIKADRGRAESRKVAQAVLAKVNGGTAINAAIAATGLKLPGVQPINAQRAQLAALQGRVPPPLALLFSMDAKSAKLLEAPDRSGWFVIHLDTIEHGDATGKPNVILGMRADIGRSLGQELVQQFATAARKAVGVSRNAAALAKLRADLGGSDQP